MVSVTPTLMTRSATALNCYSAALIETLEKPDDVPSWLGRDNSSFGITSLETGLGRVDWRLERSGLSFYRTSVISSPKTVSVGSSGPESAIVDGTVVLVMAISPLTAWTWGWIQPVQAIMLRKSTALRVWKPVENSVELGGTSPDARVSTRQAK